METNLKHLSHRQPALAVDKWTKQFLTHILSPLELAALKHCYKPFMFKAEGVSVYISARACKQLQGISQAQVSLFTNRMALEHKCHEVPLRLREVFEDPAEVLGLPAYVRNNLCRLQCYTLFRIMVLGRSYFENRGKFGPASIKAIDDLFAKHRCGHLF